MKTGLIHYQLLLVAVALIGTGMTEISNYNYNKSVEKRAQLLIDALETEYTYGTHELR